MVDGGGGGDGVGPDSSAVDGGQVRQGLACAGGLGVLLISLAGFKNEEPQSVKSVTFASACWA